LITSEQIRAARMLLRWEQGDLVRASGVSFPTLKRLEQKPGPLSAHVRTVEALRSALEAKGIEFTNGGQPGVSLRRAGPTSIAAEDLNASNDE
jgi:transcriptional regulator with XRE-family HTH domain